MIIACRFVFFFLICCQKEIASAKHKQLLNAFAKKKRTKRCTSTMKRPNMVMMICIITIEVPPGLHCPDSMLWLTWIRISTKSKVTTSRISWHYETINCLQIGKVTIITEGYAMIYSIISWCNDLYTECIWRLNARLLCIGRSEHEKLRFQMEKKTSRMQIHK